MRRRPLRIPRLLLPSLLLAIGLAGSASAHELGLVQVEAQFLKDGTYTVDVLVDLEHLPPETMRKTTPEALVKELDRSSLLSFDGKVSRAGEA